MASSNLLIKIVSVVTYRGLGQTHWCNSFTMQAGNLLLLVIVAFSQLTELAESNEASKYHNQIIYIESLRYRAHWLAPYIEHYGKRFSSFIEAPERDVIGHSWAKWMVRPGPGETITLESVYYPHNYLIVEGVGFVKVDYYAHPNGAEEALWYMDSRGGNIELNSSKINNYQLDTRFVSSIQAYMAGVLKPGRNPYSFIRIYQPAINEGKTLISVFDNSKGNTIVTHTFKETVGISKTTSTTVSITTELGVEIKAIFTAQLSATWSQTESETWSEKVEKSIKVDVLPGYVKRIYQQIGYYGPFQIESTQLFFEDSEQK